jgi:hypothetical protein
MPKLPERFTSLWRPKKLELDCAPVLESNPLSSWKPAFRPPPRSSTPLKPKREALLFILVVVVSPIFSRSIEVLIRP